MYSEELKHNVCVGKVTSRIIRVNKAIIFTFYDLLMDRPVPLFSYLQKSPQYGILIQSLTSYCFFIGNFLEQNYASFSLPQLATQYAISWLCVSNFKYCRFNTFPTFSTVSLDICGIILNERNMHDLGLSMVDFLNSTYIFDTNIY